MADNLTNSLARWRFPSGTILPAGGFLLVWADDDTDQNTSSHPDLHAAFRLSQTGEVIGLFAPEGTLVDSMVFGAQTSNVSQGRWPDGGTNIDLLATPTPRTPNAQPRSSTEILTLQSSLAATGELVITWTSEPGRTYQIQTTDNLGVAPWERLAEVLAAGPVQAWAIPVDDTPKRFYRVVLITP